MISLARLRRVAAILVALSLAAATLAIAPVPAALAATDNSSATLLRYIDAVRADSDSQKLARNEYLADYAQAWAVRLARANGREGSTVIAPSASLPPVDSNNTAPALINVQCVDRKNGGAALDNGIRYCLRYDYDFFTANESFNHVAIGVVETATKTFAVMVMAAYPNGAPRKMVSGTPTISGSGRVGAPLTADVGSWTPTRIAFSFAWRVNGTTVATTRTFTPQAHHHGSTVTVAVTGTRSGYWSPRNPRTSAGKLITLGTIKPGTVTVVGARNVGQTLAATSTPWTPAVNVTHQWFRAGAVIPGQTGSSYSLTPDDLGKAVFVRVTGSAPGFANASVTTATTLITRGRLFSSAPTPTISGTVQVGETLAAQPGDWAPGPVTFTYRWYINSVVVDDATSSSFVVPATSVGKSVVVRVTASRDGYVTTSRSSAPTSPVASRPFTTVVAPVISGSTLAGRTLTAQTGAWSPSAVMSYRWYRDGVAIAGATAASFVTRSSDRGTTISVRAIGQRAGYTTASVFSAPVTVR